MRGKIPALLIISILSTINLFSQTNFTGLGSNDSGGPGFKTVASNSNIVVSNDMTNDGTDMYNPNNSSFEIKANGTTVNFFTFEAMNIRALVNTDVDVSSTVTFIDKDENVLQTMTLNSTKNLTTNTTALTSFFDNGTNTPIDNVAKIVFDLATPVQGFTANYNYVDITLSDFALPVELNSFTASVVNDKVELNWQTATEMNNYGFALERSTVKDEWLKIGFVEGAGNSNTAKAYSFQDNLDPDLDHNLSYRLKQIDLDGKFTYSKKIEVSVENIPSEFALEQNYPNPFNPTTTIKYSIPNVETLYATSVQLNIYNLLGQEVATLVNKQQVAGNYEVKFDGSSLASGVYLYKLQAGEFTSIKRFVLMK